MPLPLVVLSYAIVCAVVYGSTLTIFFLSDDFEFLDIVAAAGNVRVIFEPLVGRFVRPFVVLTYYLNYQALGLAPWGYHLTVLVVHLVASCLVFAVACRLGGPRSRAWAWLAGLLFLVFSGHSEAVTWVAGIADPLVTVCLLTAFLAYLRSLEPGASAWWLGGMLVSLTPRRSPRRYGSFSPPGSCCTRRCWRPRRRGARAVFPPSRSRCCS